MTSDSAPTAPAFSRLDDEGLTAEQRKVCREATAVRAYPSPSLYGSFQEAVAAGLLSAEPIFAPLQPRVAVDSRADATSVWAPVTAAMAAQLSRAGRPSAARTSPPARKGRRRATLGR